jgi:hypothetical protein
MAPVAPALPARESPPLPPPLDAPAPPLDAPPPPLGDPATGEVVPDTPPPEESPLVPPVGADPAMEAPPVAFAPVSPSEELSQAATFETASMAKKPSVVFRVGGSTRCMDDLFNSGLTTPIYGMRRPQRAI